MWKTGFMTTKMYYLSVKYMENFVLLLENTKLIKDEKKLIELNKNHSDMIRALFEYNRIFQ